jgi:hypothetical protein
LGNRLSQFKVTKVRPVEDAEDTSVEAEEEVEAEEPEDSQSSKKKIEPEPVIEEDGPASRSLTEGRQAALFGEAKPPYANAPGDKPKAGPLVNGQPPKAKAPKPKEAKQADLFGPVRTEKPGGENQRKKK